MFYSRSTKGFYITEIHGENMPDDVVEITTEYHALLMEGQTAGKIISPDAEGRPILVDPPLPGYAELRVAEYPSFADQFDLLYHGGYDAWKSVITSVKEKYPKPEV